MNQTDERWKSVGADDAASWYLDPEVAEQKRRVHAELLLRSVPAPVGLALKTDSFEEAYGNDSPMPAIRGAAHQWLGMDVAAEIVGRAQRRNPGVAYFASDIRRLALRDASVDLVFSNSTLDHFETVEEIDVSLRELARITKPGGLLILTLDNPLNPLYWPLRWFSGTKLAPFPLGCTMSAARLRRSLERNGYDVRHTGFLIHNPRLISTALFLLLRKLSGRRGGALVRRCLAAFQLLDRLPTRRFTACFHSAEAVKRGGRRSQNSSLSAS